MDVKSGVIVGSAPPPGSVHIPVAVPSNVKPDSQLNVRVTPTSIIATSGERAPFEGAVVAAHCPVSCTVVGEK